MSAARYGRNRHLFDCFGKGDPDKQALCECPASCRELCRSVTFTRKHSPRVTRKYGKTKPYISMLRSFFHAWPVVGDQLLADSVKMTYGLLLTFTRDDRGRRDSRWVWATTQDLAELRGIPVTTMRSHIRQLVRLNLIMSVPRRAVDAKDRSNGKTIFIKDLPEWWPARETFKKALPEDHEMNDEELEAWFAENPDYISDKELEEDWEDIDD